MKIHSPSRTYNQGDRCKIYHTLEGITQYYTMEATGIIFGEFYPSIWRNRTPRIWRLSTLDMDGFVYSGDTIFVDGVGYKNTSNGIQLIREFINEVMPIYAYSGIFTDRPVQSYEVKVENSFAESFIRNSNPNWSKFSNSGASIRLLKIKNQVNIKVTTVDAPTCFLSGVTPTPHKFTIFKDNYTLGTISTPDTGNETTSSISYNLSSTPNDFQCFLLTNVEGIVSIKKYPVNVNI